MQIRHVEGDIMKHILRNLLKTIPLYRSLTAYRNIRKFRVLTEHEKRCVLFYQQFIEPGDLVFDVGANMGSRTKVFLTLSARVVAFEPQKICSDFLKSVLKQDDSFTLVVAALGDREGDAEMLVSKAHTISTLSEHWVKATKESGRFSQYEWNEKQHVHVTTLESAIQEYGTPSFIKIDVEGYEFEVLSGLRRPIRCISIEFAAENIGNTYRCIEYMSSLTNVSFQFSAGESMHFQLPTWVSKEEIRRMLAKISDENGLAWGDVYIRNIGSDP
jgi:FkbM family methyltransferase